MATVNDHYTVVKLLLQRGADVDVRDKQGIDAIQHALKRRHFKTMTILEKFKLKLDKYPKSSKVTSSGEL